MFKVTVVLVNDGYASTAIAPLEVFSSAGVLPNAFAGRAPQPRFSVTIASTDGGPVTSAHRMAVMPDAAIHDIDDTDLVFVSAIGLDIDGAMAAHGPLLEWLGERQAGGAMIAGVCAGVSFLAESGVLDGKRATTHWALGEEFARRYPDVDWRTDMVVTEDDGVFCGGGIYSALDLSLYIVEKLCGHEIAVDCARSMLVDMPRMMQAGYAMLPLAARHADGAVREAERWLQRHFREEVRMEALAARLAMSPRTFERRFKAATGKMPRAYLQALRITAARQMLEDGGRSIKQVGCNVGYDDAAFFRGLFKRHTGMSPTDYRARFGKAVTEAGEFGA